MRDFIMAAVPLVVTGIALAVFFAGRAKKKKKQEKENGYESMGMSLGMCFGAAVGAMFPEYIGVTLSMGMLTGWSSECVSGRSTNRAKEKYHEKFDCLLRAGLRNLRCPRRYAEQ